MAVLDAQNTFSNLASGDSPTAVADTPSASYIDQGVKGLNFSPPGGGAYVAPWVKVRVTTAFTTAASGTIAAVLQDAPEPSTTMTPTGPTTWTDRIVGPTTTAAAASINTSLLAIRLLPTMARYLRVVYRIATGVMTAGTCLAYLATDEDVIDIAMRQVGAYVSQSGQLIEAVGNSILNS